MRKILVVTSAYARLYRLWGEPGGGESHGNPTGVEYAIFSWREIVLFFWATGVFLGGKSDGHRHF